MILLHLDLPAFTNAGGVIVLPILLGVLIIAALKKQPRNNQRRHP